MCITRLDGEAILLIASLPVCNYEVFMYKCFLAWVFRTNYQS